jgi:hypothetical protein
MSSASVPSNTKPHDADPPLAEHHGAKLPADHRGSCELRCTSQCNMRIKKYRYALIVKQHPVRTMDVSKRGMTGSNCWQLSVLHEINLGSEAAVVLA